MGNEMTQRAIHARVLAESLAELNGDMETMDLIDETIDFLAEEYMGNVEEKQAKNNKPWEIIGGIGAILMMLCASGIDVPDPTANYIGCIIGVVMMLAGTIAIKRD